MADHSELKNLAEAAPEGPWFGPEYAPGTRYVFDVDLGTLLHYESIESEQDACLRYVAAANPAVVLALIAENDRLSAQVRLAGVAAEMAAHDTAGRATTEYLVVAQQRDQLKTENAGLKTGYAAYEQVNAGLKAEVEALRDGLEQIQYDANAWRNQEESVWVEVFHSDGDDPFISAITGQITIEQLAMIQAQIIEYREDYFEKGSGLYVFRCAHHQAHYDNVGMTEPAHWETDFESYSVFSWEEEGAALTLGEQS